MVLESGLLVCNTHKTGAMSGPYRVTVPEEVVTLVRKYIAIVGNEQEVFELSAHPQTKESLVMRFGKPSNDYYLALGSYNFSFGHPCVSINTPTTPCLPNLKPEELRKWCEEQDANHTKATQQIFPLNKKVCTYNRST
jgi:hypothetical protein